MPTISNDRALKAAMALLLLGSAGTAGAGPTIEIEPKAEAFASRAACEAALEKRHSAALARLAALDRKDGNRVGRLERDGGKHLSYAEKVDLAGDSPDSDMPSSQTEQFTCRENRLEHRIDFGAGGG